VIYFIREAVSEGRIKIGYTAGAVLERLAALQTSNPNKLVVVAELPGSLFEESRLHDRFASCRVHGEWFSPTPELLAFVDGVTAAKGVLPVIAVSAKCPKSKPKKLSKRPQHVKRSESVLAQEAQKHKDAVVLKVLTEQHFNKTKAAHALGITRRALHKILSRLVLTDADNPLVQRAAPNSGLWLRQYMTTKAPESSES
jgi:transcriptional regulator of acetoin/glycerol metabolism